MEFTTSYLATLAAALVIGAVVGYFYARAKGDTLDTMETSSDSDNIDELKRSLAAQFDQNAATTAQLVNTAELLKQQVILNARDFSNLDVAGHFEITTDDPTAAQPPRDWAPKSANAIGTLSEEYGLKEEPVSSK